MTIVTTVDGEEVSAPVTSTRVVAATSSIVTTPRPSLNDGEEDGSASSGLSASSKRVIGGVVGGIAGALLLAGIALVAWRVRRRRRVGDDGFDDLNSNNVNASASDAFPREKHTSGAAAGNANNLSPFRDTLDQYHGPNAGRSNVNAAANF